MVFPTHSSATSWKKTSVDTEPAKSLGMIPMYKLVDTCAADFEAYTPYYYSTYEEEDECMPSTRRKIVILGGGPNRIGQGIEFDYCCCHAVLRSAGEGL